MAETNAVAEVGNVKAGEGTPPASRPDVPAGKRQMKPIEQIVIKPGISPRIDSESGKQVESVAAEYADHDASKFPPIVLAYAPGTELHNVLLSGATRLRAAQIRGEKEILAEYRPVSDETEAFALAVTDNLRHGMRLTKKETRLAAHRLMQTGKSVEAVAEVFGVTVSTVNRWTKSLRERAAKAKKQVILDSNASTKEAATKAGLSARQVRRLRNKKASAGKEETPDTKQKSGEEHEPSASQARHEPERQVPSTASGSAEHAAAEDVPAKKDFLLVKQACDLLREALRAGRPRRNPDVRHAIENALDILARPVRILAPAAQRSPGEPGDDVPWNQAQTDTTFD